jgi:RNA-directed DNA polymerase
MMMDEVCTLDNLREAFKRVKKNKGGPGSDGQTIQDFESHLEENLAWLVHELSTGTYRHLPLRRVWIPKPGSTDMRPLGIPAVRDRVVQTALRQVMEPVFEPGFSDRSYGFRPGRGCLDALRQVDVLLRAGLIHVVDGDIKSCFDTIPHEPLLELVRTKIHDERVIWLIRVFLEAGVMEDEVTVWEPEAGTPQGGVISPLLANIYLDPLDHLMERLGYDMVRYADDFVILCRSRNAAEAAKEAAEEWMAGAGLALHPDKTQIRNPMQVGDSLQDLGYRFEQERRWPREKSVEKLLENVRRKTREISWQRLQAIIGEVNLVLQGWFGYFKHSTQRQTFQEIDERVMRLFRNRLRRSQGGRRVSNSVFIDGGLFSLAEAHALVNTRIWN